MENWWDNKPLDALDKFEWEALCDGCGWCCAHRFEDESTGDLIQTRVVCDLLDLSNTQCLHYEVRQRYVPECWVLTLENVQQNAESLPEHCAYRLRIEGKPLKSWHPLNNEGELGLGMVSVSHLAVHEGHVHPAQEVEMQVDLKALIDE